MVRTETETSLYYSDFFNHFCNFLSIFWYIDVYAATIIIYRTKNRNITCPVYRYFLLRTTIDNKIDIKKKRKSFATLIITGVWTVVWFPRVPIIRFFTSPNWAGIVIKRHKYTNMYTILRKEIYWIRWREFLIRHLIFFCNE